MKITKAQLKEIIKEEAVKLQKISILESRKKEIAKELRQLNEGEDTGNPYDLNNPSNLEEFYNKIIDVWTNYCGQKPNDWGVSNDNRVILYNLLESGELANKINMVWSPATLNLGQSGSDYYTNNPEDMKAHLNKMGVTDYTLNPGHSIRKDEERLKSFETISESSYFDEELKTGIISESVDLKSLMNGDEVNNDVLVVMSRSYKDEGDARKNTMRPKSIKDNSDYGGPGSKLMVFADLAGGPDKEMKIEDGKVGDIRLFSDWDKF